MNKLNFDHYPLSTGRPQLLTSTVYLDIYLGVLFDLYYMAKPLFLSLYPL
jgi:hypothetical protein